MKTKDLAAHIISTEETAIVHEILRACGEDMAQRLGLNHWTPPYPRHLLRRDARRDAVYLVTDQEDPVATFTLGQTAPGYYKKTLWAAPHAPAAYISRVAVSPRLQGNGLGAWCMKQSHKLALETGALAMRLDVFQPHSSAIAFYQRFGFRECGVVMFEETPLVCMEKLLNGDED